MIKQKVQQRLDQMGLKPEDIPRQPATKRSLPPATTSFSNYKKLRKEEPNKENTETPTDGDSGASMVLEEEPEAPPVEPLNTIPNPAQTGNSLLDNPDFHQQLQQIRLLQQHLLNTQPQQQLQQLEQQQQQQLEQQMAQAQIPPK